VEACGIVEGLCVSDVLNQWIFLMMLLVFESDDYEEILQKAMTNRILNGLHLRG
jgi:hypothetical protein